MEGYASAISHAVCFDYKLVLNDVLKVVIVSAVGHISPEALAKVYFSHTVNREEYVLLLDVVVDVI